MKSLEKFKKNLLSRKSKQIGTNFSLKDSSDEGIFE